MVTALVAAALLAPASMSAGHGTWVLTVEQVHARARELDGQIIYVTGMMGECRSLSCHLYSAGNPSSRDYKNMFSFASSSFDERLVEVEGEEIVLRARFDADCLTDFICTDRAPVLHPMQILRVVDRSHHSDAAE